MEKLTEKIIELVPNKNFTHCLVPDCEDDYTDDCTDESHQAEITLADVLRAMGNDYGCVGSNGGMGCFIEWDTKTKRWWNRENGLWNLSTDLDGQSDETKAFISKVLGVEETEV